MKSITEQFKSIKLNNFDYFVISLYFLTMISYFMLGWMTVLTFGGLLLIWGAFFTYKGKVFLAIIGYLIADACWIINAYNIGDYQGAVFVTIGVFFGVLATFKMSNGTMAKELEHK